MVFNKHCDYQWTFLYPKIYYFYVKTKNYIFSWNFIYLRIFIFYIFDIQGQNKVHLILEKLKKITRIM